MTRSILERSWTSVLGPAVACLALLLMAGSGRAQGLPGEEPTPPATITGSASPEESVTPDPPAEPSPTVASEEAPGDGPDAVPAGAPDAAAPPDSPAAAPEPPAAAAPPPVSPAPPAAQGPSPEDAEARRIREAEAEAARVRRALAQVVVREKAGILLRQGFLQLDTGFTYNHSSRDRLDVAGLNIIDAVFVGVQDVEQVERNVFRSSFGLRYGIFDDVQLSVTLPYEWNKERAFRPEDIERVPVPREVVKDKSGTGFGDATVALSYHFFPETRILPDLVATASYKFDNGSSPYDAGSDGIPTGTGHRGFRSGISFVKSSEPAVIFGSAGYFFHLPKSDIFDTRTKADFAEIDPGDTFSYSLGIGFALNWNLSISAQIEHSITSETEVTRILVDGPRRRKVSFTNPGSDGNSVVLSLGATYSLGSTTSLDVNVGMGLTRDAPDVTLRASMPFTINANDKIKRMKLPRLWRP